MLRKGEEKAEIIKVIVLFGWWGGLMLAGREKFSKELQVEETDFGSLKGKEYGVDCGSCF